MSMEVAFVLEGTQSARSEKNKRAIFAQFVSACTGAYVVEDDVLRHESAETALQKAMDKTIVGEPNGLGLPLFTIHYVWRALRATPIGQVLNLPDPRSIAVLRDLVVGEEGYAHSGHTSDEEIIKALLAELGFREEAATLVKEIYWL